MTDTGNAYLRGPHEYNVLLRSEKAKKKKSYVTHYLVVFSAIKRSWFHSMALSVLSTSVSGMSTLNFG